MKTKQMKAKLRIEQGQLTITPEDPSHQDMIEYYFDCDAVEMDAIEVTMEVIVDGPDMFGEIDSTWLEVIPLGEKDKN